MSFLWPARVKAIMTNLIDMLFGCWHKNVSFPITNKISSKPGQKRSEAASLTGTYVVCLQCGKEFPYDWEAMRIVEHPPIFSETVAQSQSESYAAK